MKITNPPDDEREYIKYLRDVVDRSEPKLRQSSAYVSIFSKNFHKDPKCLVELGMAILLDKPICLIAIDDEVVPQNIKRMAYLILRARSDVPGDIERAAHEIAKAADENFGREVKKK